jgi:hypothetical protein
METQAQRNRISNKPYQASFDANRSSTSLRVKDIAKKTPTELFSTPIKKRQEKTAKRTC